MTQQGPLEESNYYHHTYMCMFLTGLVELVLFDIHLFRSPSPVLDKLFFMSRDKILLHHFITKTGLTVRMFLRKTYARSIILFCTISLGLTEEKSQFDFAN